LEKNIMIPGLIEAAASESTTEDALNAFIQAASESPNDVCALLEASPWSAASILRLHALRIPGSLGLALVMALIHTRSEAVFNSISDPWTFEEILLIEKMASRVFSALDRMGELARFRPSVREHVNRAFQRMVEDQPNHWKGTVDVAMHARILARQLAPLPPELLQEGIEAIKDAANMRHQPAGLRIWANTEARWMRDYVLKALGSGDLS
jgi:hypothetical protein